MSVITLRVKRLHPEARLPVRATDGAACFDLHALGVGWGINAQAVDQSSPVVFRTGLAFEVPPGHVLLIFSRSGHGFNSDTRLSNCVGVIDSDYRGEVAVKLHCDGPGSMFVNDGDRIAQAMLVELPAVSLQEVHELSKTERGAGGFGSTGS